MRYLIFDKDPLFCNCLSAILQTENCLQLDVMPHLTTDLKTLPADFLIIDVADFIDEISHFLKTIPTNIPILIISANTDFAFQAFQYENIIDYLQKPLKSEQIQVSLHKIEKFIARNAQHYDCIFIKSERKYYRIMLSNILFISGLKDYSIIHTKEQNYTISMNISQIHTNIDQNIFVRINKSYIINLNHINYIEKNDIFIGDQKLPIGQCYKKLFFNRINTQLLLKS
jgi:DNA-binding LytR/AlgR family response regulator